MNHRKDEFSVIIIGLDGAGKTVRTRPRYWTVTNRLTLLSLPFGFTDAPREDQDPVQRHARLTTGQDCPDGGPEQCAPLAFLSRSLFIQRHIHTYFYHSLLIQPGRYPCPWPCSNSGILEANAGFDPFGRSTTATATQSSTSSMRSTTNASARAGKSSVRPLSPPITFDGDQLKTEKLQLRWTARYGPLRPADPRRPTPPAGEQAGPPRIAFCRGDPARLRGVVPAQDRERAAETGQRDG